MIMEVRELRGERAKLISEARKILDSSEKRKMTADEESKYKLIDADIDSHTDRINSAEARAVNIAKLAEMEIDIEKNSKNINSETETVTTADESFKRFLVQGMSGLTETEMRTMQVGTGPGGGFLVIPQRFVKQLIQEVDDQVIIRGLATIHRLAQAESLGVPTVDTDIADADWTTELGTGTEGTMTFGKRELKPSPLAKRVKISNRLLALSDVETTIRQRLAYKFSVSEEKAYMTGDGIGKPLGIFVNSVDGIPGSRDVSTDNTTTNITADGLINAKLHLKGQYHRRARWIFHRDGISHIRRMKYPGTAEFVWQEGLAGGLPDRILGLPYIMSEFAPNVFSSGLYVGILGDFSQYWIAEASGMQIQRLVELYAETNQTGFIARRELDGAPVLGEAFVRVTLA